MVQINGHKACRHVLDHIVGKCLYPCQRGLGRPIGLEGKQTDHADTSHDKKKDSPANGFSDQAVLGQAGPGHGKPGKYIVFRHV